MKQYFEILELQPGATPDEVKTAYRDLAKVWHPDRFKSDSPRLKSKAAEKLAEINEAYEKIRAYQARQKARKQASDHRRTSSGNSSNHTGYRPYNPGGASPGGGNSHGGNTFGGNTYGGNSYSGYARPTPNGRSQHRRPPGSGATRPQSGSYRRSRHHSSSSRPRPGSSNGNVGHSSGAGHSNSSRSSKGGTTQTPFGQPQTPTHTLTRRRQAVQYSGYGHNYTYAYNKKRRRAKNSMAIYLAGAALLAITVAGIFFFMKQSDSAPPTLADWKSAPTAMTSSGDDQPESTTPAEPLDATATESLPAEASLLSSNRPVNTRKLAGNAAPAGYFTIGSTKSQVIAVQGDPEQEMKGLIRYGFSSVFFEDDIVTGWRQSNGTRLQVKIVPRQTYERSYFTKGSTRDEVIAIQGTPDHYRDHGRELRYGESRVTFEKGRVVSWHQHADTPLKAKLLPEVFSDATHFTYNSTRDEVLSVQGTPTHFGENTLHYGYSTVQFKDNRVVGWNQAASYPLKINLEPTVPTSTKFFTKGSTRNEVIAAQGTPDQYSEQILKYGHSSISFQNDRVVSWYESAASPLKVRDE